MSYPMNYDYGGSQPAPMKFEYGGPMNSGYGGPVNYGAKKQEEEPKELSGTLLCIKYLLFTMNFVYFVSIFFFCFIRIIIRSSQTNDSCIFFFKLTET